MSTPSDSIVTMVTSPEPSPPSTPASTTPSTPSTTSTTSTNTSSNTNLTNYQIPNMNVYISKMTCRELNIIHHPHTETNIHPATLLARIHFNEAQLFYLRSHSAAYPIVTTLFALPQDDWFECRIYPYPNGIPPMMIPPPPITTPLVTTPTATTPSTPNTLNLPPIPIPTPLVHSSSLHSLFMNQTASPIDSKFSNKSNIHSPLPLINIHDHWYLRQNQSPVTTSTTSPITSTPSSLSSSPSVNTFPAFLQHDVGATTTLSQFPYPTTTPPTNINIQHIQYQIPQQATKPTITPSSRKRKSSTSGTTGITKKHKDKKRTTRSTRKQEGHEEEEEEEESELSTPSDIEEEEEEDSRPSSPDPLALPTSDAELFKRKKVLKKVYKKRYQQKKSIKRKIARFHATGDKAVVIFVTRNSQRKFGYDVEFYNPISSSNDFMNRFWREQQSLVESYLQHHYTKNNNHRNNNNNEVREEEENHHYDVGTYPINSKYQGSTEVGVPAHYTQIEQNA